MVECPVCKAPGECPVEDGVTYHRQYPPPPPLGWRPTREQVERAVARRPEEEQAELRARVAGLWPEVGEQDRRGG